MKEITLSNGHKAYVGRNSVDNENMVTFFKNTGFTWIHLDEYSGPHVIIEDPTDKREAAVYAAGKLSGRLDFVYCSVDDLTKTHKCAVGEYNIPENCSTFSIKVAR